MTLQHQQSVENAAKAYRLSLFDKRFRIYEKFVLISETYERKDFDDAAYSNMTNLSQEAGFVFNYEFEIWLDDIAREIYDSIEFKKENPLMQGTDSFGSQVILDNAYDDDPLEKFGMHKTSITDQFLPEVRSEKFGPFMIVSDQPYIPPE